MVPFLLRYLPLPSGLAVPPILVGSELSTQVVNSSHLTLSIRIRPFQQPSRPHCRPPVVDPLLSTSAWSRTLSKVFSSWLYYWISLYRQFSFVVVLLPHVVGFVDLIVSAFSHLGIYFLPCHVAVVDQPLSPCLPTSFPLYH